MEVVDTRSVRRRESLYQGDKEHIFQILEWLFDEQQRQPGLLHKRAFVGFYLSNIDVSQGIHKVVIALLLYSLARKDVFMSAACAARADWIGHLGCPMYTP